MIARERQKLWKKSAIEHRRIAAMVTEARHDDAPRLKGMDELFDGLCGQIRLVADRDHGGVAGFRQSAHSNGVRAAYAVFRLAVLYCRQGKPRQRVYQAWIV